MAPRATPAERKISPLGVIAPPPIHVETATFDGSLAMLFTCVRDRKIDLLEVPLFPICEAYFEYLLNNENQNLDEAAAALSALSYLLERKAWMLLPVADPEPEYEPPLALPDPTAHEYRVAMDVLALWHEERQGLFFRSPDAGPDPYELPYQLANVSAQDLARALERVLNKAEPEPPEPPTRAKRSIQEQMRIVIRRVTDDWQSLEELIEGPFGRQDVVYWFLAILELMRVGKVNALVDGEDVRFATAKARPRIIQDPEAASYAMSLAKRRRIELGRRR
jgi:segregation and condensation protein A